MSASKVPFRARKRLKNSDIRNCFISFTRRKEAMARARSPRGLAADDGIDFFDTSLSGRVFAGITYRDPRLSVFGGIHSRCQIKIGIVTNLRIN
jgi:hypothetical protein